MNQISGNIVDIFNKNIYPGVIKIENGKILSIEKTNNRYSSYILPGFIDSHVHIESSMVPPYEFGRAAIKHGTVAVVADPHEIANVMGKKGVEYMLENQKNSPLKFFFGAPSSVPASQFETSGSKIDLKETKDLLDRDDITHLGEVMDIDSVLKGDLNTIEKIKYAINMGKKVDGHAPSLNGINLKKYCSYGITTDHEVSTLIEGLEKIANGMVIQIRDGSATTSLKNLIPLIKAKPESCMLCSDDIHPDHLVKSHINSMVKTAIKDEVDLFDILYSASVTPVKHYNIPVGLLQVGDFADFIEVEDLHSFSIIKTVINGEIVYKDSKVIPPYKEAPIINKFKREKISLKDIEVIAETDTINVIGVEDQDIITKNLKYSGFKRGNTLPSSFEKDILKVVVVNRYNQSPPAIGFVKGIGIKDGGFASSVLHDTHNIIAVGVKDIDIVDTVNGIIQQKGGLSVKHNNIIHFLPLPIAGLMSPLPIEDVAKRYINLDQKVKEMGSNLKAPFMTLSFLGLTVIPELKLSDKGLFDGKIFQFIPLFYEGTPV